MIYIAIAALIILAVVIVVTSPDVIDGEDIGQ